MDEDDPPSQIPFVPDATEEWTSELYVARVLEHGKRAYSAAGTLRAEPTAAGHWRLESRGLAASGLGGTDFDALYDLLNGS